MKAQIIIAVYVAALGVAILYIAHLLDPTISTQRYLDACAGVVAGIAGILATQWLVNRKDKQ